MVQRTPVNSWLRQHWHTLSLVGACFLLVLLWLPGLQYPIAHDAAAYALLSKNIWHGTYSLFGQPYAQHLPFHAAFSYPFVAIMGDNLGMQISTLMAGLLMLVGLYLFVQQQVSARIASVTVLFAAVHHGVVYQSFTGYADLLFSALFLYALWSYGKAGNNARWYIATGVFTGLACLTRYNGLPLFPLFLGYTFWARRAQSKAVVFWVGGLIGVGIFSLLLVRNAIAFGNPVHSYYWAEQAGWRGTSAFQTVAENVVYYLNPLQNILPILLIAALYALYKHGRSSTFLWLSMLTGWLVAIPWPVQSIRFALPGHMILLAYAAWGITEWWQKKTPRQPMIRSALIVTLLLTHTSALCLYSYGWCNATADRTFSFLPANLGLTQEGLHSFNLARRFLNQNATSNSQILIENPVEAAAWQHEVFLEDLVVSPTVDTCPVYRIYQNREPVEGSQLYRTATKPTVVVTRQSCADLGMTVNP